MCVLEQLKNYVRRLHNINGVNMNNADNRIMEKKKQFGEFMTLLKELRESDKISAEELRDYRKNWENYPQNRKILIDTLTIKRTKYVRSSNVLSRIKY